MVSNLTVFSIKPVITDIVMLHSLFQPRTNRWRKLNRTVTSSTLLQKWHIHTHIDINKQAIWNSFHWYGTEQEKGYTHSESGSQRQGRDKFDASFAWGSPSSQESTTTEFKYFGNDFYMIRQRTCCYYFSENYLNFQHNFLGNVDLTGTQHSKHQRFWGYPFSPMEASSRLPNLRDHLFLQSMSKASLPQGPDMWYLTFYENKVPINQTTISNSL